MARPGTASAVSPQSCARNDIRQASLQIVRGRLQRGVVRARLQQQDPAARILRQPRRQHRTGRAATHDDVVVFHVPGPSRGSQPNGSPVRLVKMIVI